MINFTSEPLEFFLDRLRGREQFAFVRYGDGEFYAMYGHAGGNCDGHQYFPEMGAELIKTMTVKAPNYIFGIQPLAVSQSNGRIENILSSNGISDIEWINSDVFHNASISGVLFPLVEALRGCNTVLIGPKHLAELKDFLGFKHHIVVPDKDCYTDIARMQDEIRAYGKDKTGVVYMFSASMPTEIMISRLFFELPGNTFIDLGSLWDVFTTTHTRQYHGAMAEEIKNKNMGL